MAQTPGERDDIDTGELYVGAEHGSICNESSPCHPPCRRPVEEAQVVHRANETAKPAQQPSADGNEAHLDPLSDSHPQVKQQAVPVDVTAERRARRERALKAQQEQDAAKAAAEESESEYETVRFSQDGQYCSRTALPHVIPCCSSSMLLDLVSKRSSSTLTSGTSCLWIGSESNVCVSCTC